MANADALADQAINLLAQQAIRGQLGAPAESALLAIAEQIAGQQGRQERHRAKLDTCRLWYISHPSDPIEEEEARNKRMSDCLRRLSDDDRELLRLYYSGDHAQRFSLRRSLSATLQLSPSALRKRAVRLRAAVEGCARRQSAQESGANSLHQWLGRAGNSRK